MTKAIKRRRGKASHKSPGKSSSETQHKSFHESFHKSPSRSAKQSPQQSPGKSPTTRQESPRQSTQKSPQRSPQRSPQKSKTLDRVISKAGLGSRTEARRWIMEGRVAIDGHKVNTPDMWVDPTRDRVTLDGRPLTEKRKLYLLLNKPKGYLTTTKDPEGRKTVYDLLADVKDWLIPVGRLDQDTSGLLIMTNDTAFGDFVTSPESKVAKTYLVKSSLLLSDDQLDQLRRGVELADGPTSPAVVKRVRDSARYTFFEITITEGRNRQVRRMVEALGAKVLKLVRVKIGSISIGDLEIAKYRELTPAEVAHLYRRGAAADGRVGKDSRRNASTDSSSRSL